MDVIKKAIQMINPEQAIVIAFDQPLLAPWLKDSGWTTVIHNSGITGTSTADSFLE